MFTKQIYEAPQAEMFQLSMVRSILEASETGSAQGTGANVTFDSESDFDSVFNPQP